MLVAIIAALLFLLSPANVEASSKLIVSANSNFSPETTAFASNQNIFVKLESDAPADRVHQVNLRDNNYNFIQSFNLSKSGNIFSASLTSPSAQGYYSLEAVIESQGKSIKSVKTIKVGSPDSANIKVNVKSSHQTSVDSSSETQSTQDTDVSPTPSSQPTEETSPVPQEEKDKPLISAVFLVFKAIFSFLWPF